MNSALCRKLGIEFPLFAFSHCRDVVAAVSNAGGFGVLGAVAHTAESLAIDLKWIDEHVNGMPYGIDLLIPNKMEDKEGGLTAADLEARVPPEHRRHVAGLLARHGIDTADLWSAGQGVHDYTDNMREGGAARTSRRRLQPSHQAVRECAGRAAAFDHETRTRQRASWWAPSPAPRNMRSSTPGPGSTFSWSPAPRQAGTAARSRPWCWCPRCCRRSRTTRTSTFWRPEESRPGGRWRRAWPWAPTAPGTASVWLTTAEAETTPTVKKKDAGGDLP